MGLILTRQVPKRRYFRTGLYGVTTNKMTKTAVIVHVNCEYKKLCTVLIVAIGSTGGAKAFAAELCILAVSYP
jgi:hypothetical protein